MYPDNWYIWCEVHVFHNGCDIEIVSYAVYHMIRVGYNENTVTTFMLEYVDGYLWKIYICLSGSLSGVCACSRIQTSFRKF